MPTLCMFFGIVVKMYAESGTQHNLPHIHAEYQGAKVVVDLDGNVIEGKFPGSKMRLLLAWIEIHQRRTNGKLGTVVQWRRIFQN